MTTEDLFVGTYRAHYLPVFNELNVEGLPAVDEQAQPDSTSCTTTVGVADHQTLDVQMTVTGFRGDVPIGDPCVEGHRVAKAIVSTLPAQ